MYKEEGKSTLIMADFLIFSKYDKESLILLISVIL